MKRLILSMIMMIILSGYASAYTIPDSYMIINPSIKILKEENGNGAMDVSFAKGKIQINDKFSFSGSASVGFTSPRASITSYNHYVNMFMAKATWKPFKGLGIGIESSWAYMIPGHDSDVSYFRTENYQAIVIEIDHLIVMNLF